MKTHHWEAIQKRFPSGEESGATFGISHLPYISGADQKVSHAPQTIFQFYTSYQTDHPKGLKTIYP